MIIELCEFLVAEGVESGLADDIHDAYAKGGIESAVELGTEGEFDGDEIRMLVKMWQKESGEA